MTKKLQQLAAFFLAVLLLMPSATAATPPEGAIVMRIGLLYGDGAVPGANLENSVGTGHRFGYYDENEQFFQVGYTGETKISVAKTQNVSYGYAESYGRDTYSDAITSGITVGCYHVQLPGTYPDFERAKAAAAQTAGGFPLWTGGTYAVRVGSYTTQEEAAAALAALGVQGATTAGSSGYAVSVVRTGTSEILFQFDGGAGFALGVKPGLDDSVRTVTHFKGLRYYGGFQFARTDGGNLTIVNVVPLEDYVKCVIAQEMSPSWPLEALKAQSVCARTYSIISLDRHKQNGFDLCATTHCQACLGLGESNAASDRAVDETAGVYAWYQKELAQTYYYSNDGGATEHNQNVWGGSAIPYLKGVTDPYEAGITDLIPKHKWTVTFTGAELTQILRNTGYANCAEVVDFYVTERSPTGNVIAFAFRDAAGKTYTFSNKVKERCRTMLGLRSINYTIAGGTGSYFVNDSTTTMGAVSGAYAVDGSGNVAQIGGAPHVITGTGTAPLPPAATGTASGVFILNGSGWGHLVGMSQWGAYAMAKQGKTYNEILKFYFTGIDVR